MFHVVLFQPEIPPNTGNIIRLCANTGMQLHLIRPLGFIMDDKRLVRAGLDYHEWARVALHDDFGTFLETAKPTRVFAMTTKGDRGHHEVDWQAGDAILMGPETRGLPEDIRHHPAVSGRIRLPMLEGSRSLNLSNATAVVVYEAWRQTGFAGAISGPR
jgi:tRNA (cytidine/uridine-2'-O-)-methyltransferase